jgi:hypothetical protein
MIMKYERGENDTFATTDALKSPEQIKVQFTLTGAKGTDEKSPIRTGEYPARKNVTDYFDNVGFAEIHYFEDGKQKSIYFRDSFNGKVIVNLVTDDTITGTIDISKDDGSAIKGDFTAKVRKSM